MPVTHHDPTKLDDPVVWGREGSDLGRDPVSDAVIRRLTSGPMMNHNYYCEQPYCSADGKRVIVYRGRDFSFDPDYALLFAAPDNLSLVMVERSIPCNFVKSSYRDWVYYMTHGRGLRRVSMATLQREQLLPDGAIDPEASFQTITPDGRLIISWHDLGDRADAQLVAYDTTTGAKSVLMAREDNRNPHAQVDPIGGQHILMQLCPGHVRDSAGKLHGSATVPVLVMDLDGGNLRYLPIGGERTAESTGHMTWITGTRRIVCAVDWDHVTRRHDPRHPQGNLVITSAGDTRPTIFTAPEHGFYHVSVSRCGRFFVGDDFMDFHADAFGSGRFGPIRLVVGCFDTGKYRVLVSDVHARGLAGSSRWEPDPYLTADNRWVIFNSSPFGTNQVFAAAVTPQFLNSLT